MFQFYFLFLANYKPLTKKAKQHLICLFFSRHFQKDCGVGVGGWEWWWWLGGQASEFRLYECHFLQASFVQPVSCFIFFFKLSLTKFLIFIDIFLLFKIRSQYYTRFSLFWLCTEVQKSQPSSPTFHLSLVTDQLQWGASGAQWQPTRQSLSAISFPFSRSEPSYRMIICSFFFFFLETRPGLWGRLEIFKQ